MTAFWTNRRRLLTAAGGLGVATSLGACANGQVIGFD
jgi:hypothetical protein